MPFAPFYFVGTHTNHVLKAQPPPRRLHVGEEHPPHPRVALAEDLAGTLHGDLPHQGSSEDFELQSEVLAASLSRRGHLVHLAVIAPVPPRQRTHNQALPVEDIQMTLLHRLDMVVEGYRGSVPSTFFSRQLVRLLIFQKICAGILLKPRIQHRPTLPKPPFLVETAKNLKNR